ncbi:mechanosensitive ion channel domain-containing protein [Cellulomonas marina]|uniref:Mechanosensitive ion channel n=1 Tax=Cellulomonas marina TaxID=988821 RepID=A0A1I0ZK44_9CELL|nr:mechanosensitive ion channel domain-containing protein [Cellulomonas marina]SFB24900.1 Mechanosensitive ion channel [Cellulomonas marina]
MPSLPLPTTLLEAVTPAAGEEDSVVREVVVPLASVAVAVVLALVVSAVVGLAVRRLARRWSVLADLSHRSRRPLRWTLVVLAAWSAIGVSTAPAQWRSILQHGLLIAIIGLVAWLLGSLAFVLEDAALARYRVDVVDNRHARRVRTQIQVLRRITVAVLVLCALAAALLTFPSARAVGASVFASAGLLSIVAGLAAQSSLANVFAGLQLAFTDAIRVDDVVIVEGEWGRIEEITLTYVVVHVWDDRRLILPSTHFTTTPFENWTRRASQLLGTVELDLDWDVPVDAMRARLSELLAQTPLWDQRVGILQVTEATGGVVRVRVLASAADAPTLFDLRCYLREGLVVWLQQSAREALPRSRWEGAAPPPGEEPEALARRLAAAAAREQDARAEGNPHLRPASGATPEARGGRSADVAAAAGAGRADERPGLAATAVQPTVRPAAGPGSQGTPAPAGSGLFTGSLAAVERSRAFAGPGDDVIAERERTAAAADAEEAAAARGADGRGSGATAVVLPAGDDDLPADEDAAAPTTPVDDGATQVLPPVRAPRTAGSSGARPPRTGPSSGDAGGDA